jgi:hypothetical protein
MISYEAGSIEDYLEEAKAARKDVRFFGRTALGAATASGTFIALGGLSFAEGVSNANGLIAAPMAILLGVGAKKALDEALSSAADVRYYEENAMGRNVDDVESDIIL